MIKKISILTILLLFFVSTTGLPLTVHFCNMVNKEVSATCDMGMSSIQMEMMHKACHEQRANDNIVSMKALDCCKTETIIAGIKDSFIANKTEPQKNSVSEVISLSIIPVVFSTQKIFTYSLIDTSPPSISSNHIYIYNSVFLI